MSLHEVLEKLEQENSEGKIRVITRDAAEVMSVLLRSMNPKTIVEVGTGKGYSTIWLALSAISTGGKVYSYDIVSEASEHAKKNLESAGVSEVVTLKSEDFLSADLPESVDFVFLDGDRKQYPAYFDKIFSKLNDGGVIFANDVIGDFEDLRPYIELVRDHPECDSVMIPVGEGVEVTYRFRKGENKNFKDYVLVR